MNRNISISYPISNLSELTSITNLSSTLMEVVVDDYGNETYVNKQASFETFGEYIVSSYPIFNKINELYHDRTVVEVNSQTGEFVYKYANSIYFSDSTYFNSNPIINNSKSYFDLQYNQTVSKDQLLKYLAYTGLGLQPMNDNLNCYQYAKAGNQSKWTENFKQPTINERYVIPFLENNDSGAQINQSTNCEISNMIGDGPLYSTKEITIPSKNTFMTIIGKIKIPEEKLHLQFTPYYTSEFNLWAGLLHKNNLIAITELHNIVDDIAYFSFQLPIFRGTSSSNKFKIVVPFKPENDDNEQQETINERDIFRNMKTNSVCLFYY